MSILSSLFTRKKASDEVKGELVGGMEDFMSLIRVYYQAVMASSLGITNLGMLPDLRVFKQTLHVPTVNNKLGLGEKNRCKKMLIDLYGMQDFFFKEIDQSIKNGCRNANDIRNYLFLFQGFSQDLMMLMSNIMKWKFRMPSVFKKTMKGMITKSINDILTKNDWKDDGVRKTCIAIRQYQQKLGYTPAWMTEYIYHIVVLAKKEPKKSSTEDEKK
ncbi:MAG: hypothetical protein RR280_04885 [Bacteroidaceae bacterium]